MIQFSVISLFPQIFTALSEYGISSRALKKNLYKIDFFNPRDFTEDVHKTVDDRPYGGGPGMLMLYQPIKDAILSAKSKHQLKSHVIYLSPQGTRFDQAKALEVLQHEHIILVCGRYEGIDQRLIESQIDEEISIGDYVLSGGEIPAMVLMDTMIRQIPGALGHSLSAEQDSFSNHLLDTPHYTRPQKIDGMAVPEVLLGGNHADIAKWRQQQSEAITKQQRPDLKIADSSSTSRK